MKRYKVAVGWSNGEVETRSLDSFSNESSGCCLFHEVLNKELKQSLASCTGTNGFPFPICFCIVKGRMQTSCTTRPVSASLLFTVKFTQILIRKAWKGIF